MLRTSRGGLTAFAAVFVLCPLGAAQASIDVDAPRRLLELETGFDVDVRGSGIYDESPELHAFADGLEITSQVTITLTDETRLDQDEDGVLEDYDGEFSVDFDTYAPSPGEVLVTEARATAPAGTVTHEDATPVEAHVTVHVDDSVATGTTDMLVVVDFERLALLSQSLSVFLDDSEVTSLVGVTGPDTSYEAVETGSPPFVRLRRQGYRVDLSGLGDVEGSRLVFAVTGTAAAGTSGGLGKSRGVEPNDLDECEEEALADFVDALGVSKDANGNVSISASPSEVEAAADQLQADIAACGANGSHFGLGSVEHTTRGGITIEIDIGGSSSKVSGEADLVVSIGKDGDFDTGSNGGTATAINDRPGGVSLAVGGDGGSGTSSAGDGGNATAVATPSEPPAPPGGGAHSIGGDGGHPLDSADAGGNGGLATSELPPWAMEGPGSLGSPGHPAGEHGGGGWVSVAPGASPVGTGGFFGRFDNP